MTATAVREPKQGYERKKARASRRELTLSNEAREIAPDMPGVKDPRRRAAAVKSLRVFCETYFPEWFYLEWSPDHLTVIRNFEAAIRKGLTQALGMPRGSGKTALVKAAALWAIITGRSRYCVIVGPETTHSEEMLESILGQLRTNDLLLEDFPEVVYPIRVVGRNAQKRPLFHGKDIYFKMEKGKVVLPWIAGSRARGSVIEAAGILGSLRGMNQTDVAGRSFRPDLCLVDDVQTDESAKSPTQVEYRLKVLRGAILNLAGPGAQFACLATVTIIRRDDVADQLLDRKRNPQWRGLLFKLMDAMPANQDLWAEYWQIREDEMRADDPDEDLEDADPDGPAYPLANQFYADNREAMDQGALPRWSQRFRPQRELSAIQHAMNLIQDIGRDVFEAEFQNAPLPDEDIEVELKPEVIRTRLSRLPRGTIPQSTTHLSAFCDVHKALLYWMVVAADENASPYVVDYDTWPDQRLREFTLREVSGKNRRNLQKLYADVPTLEGQIYKGLQDVFDHVLGQPWKTPDGTDFFIPMMGVDAQWGEQKGTVYQAIRESAHAARLRPTHGRGVTATAKPLSKVRPKPGLVVGEEWIHEPRNGQLTVSIDSNYWKSQSAVRWTTPPGSPAAAMLFGSDEHEHKHKMLSEHLCAEYGVEVQSRDRRCLEWKVKPGKPDNHWLDCFANCLVMLSMQGSRVLKDKTPTRKRTRAKEAQQLW